MLAQTDDYFRRIAEGETDLIEITKRGPDTRN
jgi:hypothetical protein